jgi:hypothetical protein
MKKTILTKEQFERQSFNHWLRKGVMYDNYDNYLKFAKAEYKSETETKPETESEPKTRKLYIWRSKDDHKVRESHAEYDDDDHKVRESHAEYDDRVFDWNDGDMKKPGEDYGCRCYAEFIEIDDDGSIQIGDKIDSSNIDMIHLLDTMGKMSYLSIGEILKGKTIYDKEEIFADSLDDLEKEEDKINAINEFVKSDEFIEFIEEAHEIKNKDIVTKSLWMYSNFKTGGRFDLKRNNPRMEHAGNFNYGVVGRAAGFNETTLKAAAGGYQFLSGTSDPSFRDSWYDDPVDQKYIKKGIEYYDKHYGNRLWE